MPFHTHLTTVSIFPHPLSRLEPSTKELYRQRYKKLKKYGSASLIAEVELSDIMYQK